MSNTQQQQHTPLVDLFIPIDQPSSFHWSCDQQPTSQLSNKQYIYIYICLSECVFLYFLQLSKKRKKRYKTSSCDVSVATAKSDKGQRNLWNISPPPLHPPWGVNRSVGENWIEITYTHSQIPPFTLHEMKEGKSGALKPRTLVGLLEHERRTVFLQMYACLQVHGELRRGWVFVFFPFCTVTCLLIPRASSVADL